jgi:hypothetical protein
MITAMTLALAGSVAVWAQDATTQTKTKVEGAGNTVKYTGCLQTGTETKSFVLNQVVPVSKVSDSSGRTITSYMLVPGPTVQFDQFVGHKVEVTGVMVSGDSKVETKTKIENDKGKDTTVKETTKSDGGMPQFRVLSVKHLADAC